MTTNEQIVAKADELAELVRAKIDADLYHAHIFYQEHLWQRVDEQAESMRRLVARFTQFDPAPLEAMLGSLRNVFGGSFGNPLADPARGYVDDVGSYITDWYGTAAEAFRMNFLNPYPEIRANQIALVRELALMLEAQLAIVTEGRAKIIEIADQGIAALNSYGVRWAVPLSVAASVVAVFAAVITAPVTVTTGAAPAVVAGTLAIVGGTLSSLSTAAGESRTPSEAVIHGDRAEEVVSTIWTAYSMLRNDMSDAEAMIVEAIEYDLEQVRRAQTAAEHRELNPFVPYGPNVIDALRSGGSGVDFRLSS